MFALASAVNIIAHIAIHDLSGLALLIAIDAAFAAAMLAVPLLHRAGADSAAHALVFLSIVAILCTLFLLGRDSQIYVYFALSGVILFVFESRIHDPTFPGSSSHCSAWSAPYRSRPTVGCCLQATRPCSASCRRRPWPM